MKTTRKLLALILTALMCLSAAGYMVYAYEEAAVTVVSDGEVLRFNPPPVNKDGYAFFPIEDLLAGLGAEHGWDGETYTVICSLGESVVEIPLRDLSYVVDGEKLDLPAELMPFVDNERTYVYLDAVAEPLGLTVGWDSATNTITVTAPEPAPEATPMPVLTSAEAKDYEFTYDGTSITITKYTGKGGEVAIPGKIDGKPVVSIGDFAFDELDKEHILTGVTIPEGVTSIGEGAFRACHRLEYAVMPSTLKETKFRAFGFCVSLKSVEFPFGMTDIGPETFFICENLRTVTVPDSVKSIGEQAFNGCAQLTSINIPDGVTEIGRHTFNGCKNLTGIDIPSSVTFIGDAAFMRCSGLTSVTIPDGITRIESDTFRECTSLASVNIPDGVTYIGMVAFGSCQNLTNITIPEGVTMIDNFAFADCGFTSVTIPASVTQFGDCAFDGCPKLSEVIFLSATPPEISKIESAEPFQAIAPGAKAIVPAGATGYGAEGSLWNGLIVTYAR